MLQLILFSCSLQVLWALAKGVHLNKDLSFTVCHHWNVCQIYPRWTVPHIVQNSDNSISYSFCAVDEAGFVLSRNANSRSNKRLIFWKSVGSSNHFLFFQVWHVLCASRVVEFVVFWIMLHSILNPVFVDLTSKEKIMVTSYTMISYSSPSKFKMECTIRVIQVMLKCILWLPRVPGFEVLQLVLGHFVWRIHILPRTERKYQNRTC